MSREIPNWNNSHTESEINDAASMSFHSMTISSSLRPEYSLSRTSQAHERELLEPVMKNLLWMRRKITLMMMMIVLLHLLPVMMIPPIYSLERMRVIPGKIKA